MNRINKLKNATGGFMHLRWLGLALILCAVTGTAHAKQEQELEFRFARILSDGIGAPTGEADQDLGLGQT